MVIKPDSNSRWLTEKYATDKAWLPHRCKVRENVLLNDGWIIQEGPLGILVGFATEDDRTNSCRNIASRGVNVLPLPELRVWMVTIYVKRACCDKGGYYRED